MQGDTSGRVPEYKEGYADYIVSGDQDLLTLEAFEGIPIIAPAAFGAILKTPR